MPTLYHDLITSGPGYTVLATSASAMSLSLHALNTFKGTSKLRVALVPNYVPAQAVATELHIEYDAGLAIDDALDHTQIIIPAGYTVLAQTDGEIAARLTGYPIADRHAVCWPAVLAPAGGTTRLGSASAACEVQALLTNLDPAPVVASLSICAPGYQDGTPPARGRSYARNVTLPAAGDQRGGVWAETRLVLDPGESIVVASGGRLACHVFGITR